MEYKIGVVGATGAVGREMISILEKRDFPIRDIRFFASSRSAGKRLAFKNREVTVEELTEDSISGCDIYLFSAGSEVSRKFAPLGAESGVVIDNSSAWRLEDDIPLVVPEVNPQDVEWHDGIIANPNCSTIQMVVALFPLHKKFKIKRIIASTYQSVSGTGHEAVTELESQVSDYVKKKELKNEVYPYPIAFNAIPRIDTVFESGYTKEEMKMVYETRKIMHAEDIKISATCVRIPVFRAHSEAVTVEFEKRIDIEKARKLLSESKGIQVMDNPFSDIYPTPREMEGTDETYVGRIRECMVFENGLSMWIVSDNLRKGAALNTIQIAETLIEKALI